MHADSLDKENIKKARRRVALERLASYEINKQKSDIVGKREKWDLQIYAAKLLRAWTSLDYMPTEIIQLVEIAMGIGSFESL